MIYILIGDRMSGKTEFLKNMNMTRLNQEDIERLHFCDKYGWKVYEDKVLIAIVDTYKQALNVIAMRNRPDCKYVISIN